MHDDDFIVHFIALGLQFCIFRSPPHHINENEKWSVAKCCPWTLQYKFYMYKYSRWVSGAGLSNDSGVVYKTAIFTAFDRGVIETLRDEAKIRNVVFR